MNEKRNTLLIVLGIIAGIFGTWSMKDGLKYINKFQAQLPLESSSDSYKMSMTGLEVRNDSLNADFAHHRMMLKAQKQRVMCF